MFLIFNEKGIYFIHKSGVEFGHPAALTGDSEQQAGYQGYENEKIGKM